MNLLDANDHPGTYPPSWYADVTPPLDPFPPLKGSHRADVCVVGGGYTGLSAALHLARAGRRVILLEAQRVGFGASGRNGGHVLAGQRVDQLELERILGRDDARKLFDLSLASVQLVRDLVTEGGIECDLQPGAGELARNMGDVTEMHRYADHLAKHYNHTQITRHDRSSLRKLINSDVFAGGLVDAGSAHLNPLAYVLGLARMAAEAGVTIREGARVVRAERGFVTTVHGRVEAEHVVLACNGYLGRLNTNIAARVMPINNYVIATETLPEGAALRQRVALSDDRFVVSYFRTTPDNRLIFGGGESYGYRFPKNIAALVRKPLAACFPHLATVPITHAWGGTLAITMSRMPYFAAPEPGVWAASGYSGHGVALATLAGRMIARAIEGDRAGFDAIARVPSRRFPGGAALRWPILISAMTWYGLRDRLGL